MGASADRRLVAGRYVLGGPLGRGGMGTVWRADDALLGRAVAVKEVDLPPGGGPAALRERALREARAAARLNHPGVVTLHDVVEAEGRLLLVMELVEAPTLRDLVERSGPLPPATAARVGLELLDALDAAHRAGIVHHDVKPANVMVTSGGRTKLADFGIASLQEDTQRTLTGAAQAGDPDPGGRAMTVVFGSLPYVAPEQASGRGAGPAADLWALGATLWFAVEGAAPFERSHPAATLSAILTDPPGRPSRAGPLEPVLLALLDKDPTRRPAAPALRRALEPLAAAPAATVPLTATARLPADRAAAVSPGTPAATSTEVLSGPGPPPAWGPPPAPPRRRRGRQQLPGWTAPPRRRRRRWLVAAVGILVLLAVARNAGEGGQGDPGPPGLGDPVRDGQFEFVVDSVECGSRSVGQGLGRKDAVDQFCLVALRVQNTGQEGRTFAGGQQHLFDEAGKRHDPDLDATIRRGDGRLLSTHLNPGQRLAGTLVYDVPERVALDRMELHDAPFSGGVGVVLD
jgi:eukaryotic-like serine/threonine-protein kinase